MTISSPRLKQLVAEATKGPWEAETNLGSPRVLASDEKGSFPICDIRGWGHLTGKGIGALGFSHDDAAKVQDANTTLIALAPSLAAEVLALREALAISHRVLADLVGGDKDLSTIHLYAHAVEAELAARKALAHSEQSHAALRSRASAGKDGE